MFFWNTKKEIGIDIVDVRRFEPFAQDKDCGFLHKTFTPDELNYCFLYKDTALHLAGIFAAKEAVSKALGVKKFPFIEIEIRHGHDGKPEAYKSGKKLPVSVSIAHTSTTAVAFAIM